MRDLALSIFIGAWEDCRPYPWIYAREQCKINMIPHQTIEAAERDFDEWLREDDENEYIN